MKQKEKAHSNKKQKTAISPINLRLQTVIGPLLCSSTQKHFPELAGATRHSTAPYQLHCPLSLPVAAHNAPGM
jgi:hypothetical protein